ncbi:MAG TPA: hypothetical protein VK671_13215 [Mucilaginibacter sp.]|jgi:hypothetical protein|nr:hypothetical protein [Mucilaginibacter sp.]
MKKTLLIALLLIPFFGFSQTTKPIDGALGIKFGSSKAVVIAALKARGGKLSMSNAHAVAFDDISLGHKKADLLIVKFLDDKLLEIDFTFKPQDDHHVIEYYNNLIADINNIYGKGESTKKYAPTYSESDENQLNDLLVGAVEYTTLWQAANNNSIQAAIEKGTNSDLNVTLSYQDYVLINKAIEKQKSKDKSDY